MKQIQARTPGFWAFSGMRLGEEKTHRHIAQGSVNCINFKKAFKEQSLNAFF
jgi:hypothetical protein